MDPRIPDAGPAVERGRSRAAWVTVLLAGAALFAFGGLRANPMPPNPHGKFKEECSLCHDAGGWKPAHVSKKFDHAKYGFPLTGAHAASRCEACHASLDFSKPEALCASCHEDPHRGELGPECERCHGATSFVDRARMMRAHQLTRFPLVGSHAALDCESCHPPTAQGHLQYVGIRPECISCHQADYDATTDPNHKTGGFPTDCAQCHSPRTWQNARFDHAHTLFPLTGAHTSVPCASCHGDGVYKGKPTACASCHRPAYDSTTDPPHGAAGYPLTCENCHTTRTWAGATFDHAGTQFPLTGAHLTVACASCHGDGVYKGKPTACASCHQASYTATTDPPHGPSGFPLTCETCHNTTSWAGATFEHAGTQFPLTGAHLTVACASCHGDGVYKGKSTACASCHQASYDATTDPPHGSLGFPLACETCHNTTNWSGARFDHDTQYFPIYSGTHAGRWSLCSNCHTNQANYAVFTCLSCHPHDDKAGTDSHHTGVSGYVYDSAHCYSCHPRGTH